jgi:hypothetical protein
MSAPRPFHPTLVLQADTTNNRHLVRPDGTTAWCNSRIVGWTHTPSCPVRIAVDCGTCQTRADKEVTR